MTTSEKLRAYRRRRFVGSVVIRAACLPIDVAGWLFVLVMAALWGRKGSLGFRDGVMVVELADGSWPARTWYRRWGGTAIGHGVMFGAGRAGERIWRHEKVHVDQVEAAACGSLLIAGLVLLASGSLAAAVVAWAVTPVAYFAGGWAAAWLRGGDAYRDSAHERAAYALDDLFCHEDRETTPRR